MTFKGAGKIAMGIALGVALFTAAAAIALRYFSMSLETEVREFRSVADLKVFAGTNDWWVPDFLPQSTSTIREYRSGDYNTGRLRARFAPKDYEVINPRFSEVLSNEWESIVPGWGKKVFPRELVEGNFNSLIGKGFRIAAVDREKGLKRPWYVAIDGTNGLIYAWTINK